ncbi:hypothetical protein F5146DRAFT_1002320 [Armillaria mellea]|nr:hypothetical protein F5146DRAFT_1002320 [Armillaria mellea]
MDADRRDRILHLIALLYEELDTVVPVPPGASLSIPSSLLPVPDDEGEELPTFACLNCSFLNNPITPNPNKYYAVTQGWAVSMVRGSYQLLTVAFSVQAQCSLTDGVTGGHASKGSSEHEAVETFNHALSQMQVKVVPKTLKL